MKTWSLENFESYRKSWKEAILEYQKKVDLYTISEAAAPSYAHSFDLISWFFWRRIFYVISYLYEMKNPGKVLDFGCGLGIILPYVQNISESVWAVDPFIKPARHFQSKMNFSGVKLYDSLEDCVSDNERFDTIITLDVLEHIENLSAKLIELRDIMEPNGRIIVSGPTENWIYKIGRLAAGFHKIYKKLGNTPGISNPFHHHTIYDVEKTLKECGFKVNPIKTLYPLLTLFRIIVAEKI
ncbi:MAG: class I SAM-dependent methyltransferase [Candidatus Aminicenantes bacterium]|jgi:2-polyprenyl-3-methyl-5-hydroxy-6-metoxy-1,4-benzoquinol methylase